MVDSLEVGQIPAHTQLVLQLRHLLLLELLVLGEAYLGSITLTRKLLDRRSYIVSAVVRFIYKDGQTTVSLL